MGAVIQYGRTRQDVRRWPDDPAARQALETYLGALPADSQDIVSVLNARELDFAGADLSGLELSEAELSQAMLSGVRLVGTDLSGAWLIGAVLRSADLSQARLRKAQGRACDARKAVLRNADLDNSEFEEADFRDANLSGARFGRSWLSGADLRDADLRGCTFGSDVRTTGLHTARIAGCRVEGASGTVSGPADVGLQEPQLLDKDDLQQWFREHGAPLVEVR